MNRQQCLPVLLALFALCLPAGSVLGQNSEQRAAAGAGMQPAETVRIDGITYPVPAPWAGHRVRVPAETLRRLVLMPRELTLGGMEISLREEALLSFARMAEAARAEGIVLQADSAYRSAVYQEAIYRRNLQKGLSFQSIARHTAPPGYSRHALGLAVDLHPSSAAFGRTPAYAWLRRHAREYGFVETYGKANSFGIVWEPWHWEYQMPEEGRATAGEQGRGRRAEGPAQATAKMPGTTGPGSKETTQKKDRN